MVEDLFESPDFPNADFYFRQDNVVAELKALEVDFASQEDFRAKLDGKLAEWLEAGEITEEQAKYPDTLPERKMVELARIPQNRLKSQLSKANKQIKVTRKKLGVPDASGLLFLVNDGLLSLSSETIINLVSDRLIRDFSGIQGFVYITLNHYSVLDGDPYPRLLWAPLYHETAPDSLVEFVDTLGSAFGEFLSTHLGPMESTIKTEDRSILGKLGYLPPKDA